MKKYIYGATTGILIYMSYIWFVLFTSEEKKIYIYEYNRIISFLELLLIVTLLTYFTVKTIRSILKIQD